MENDVMLFDEPTSALDPELTGEVLAVMKTLSTELHITMMIVTHEMGCAREMADRMAFFREGRILEEGPPSELIGSPRHAETRASLDAVLDRVHAEVCRYTWSESSVSGLRAPCCAAATDRRND